MDDVDGPSRLQLLNNPYYRDTLGEYGAFFAIANRIDRLHRNAWIGFQSWRATARKVWEYVPPPLVLFVLQKALLPLHIKRIFSSYGLIGQNMPFGLATP